MANFHQALNNLREGSRLASERELDVLTKTGLVSLFEICFEQSWKTMKSILYGRRFLEAKSGSPTTIIKLAYREGMIDDEDAWRSMLRARGMGVHTYSEVVADEIIAAIPGYIQIFDRLETEINNNWQQ